MVAGAAVFAVYFAAGLSLRPLTTCCGGLKSAPTVHARSADGPPEISPPAASEAAQQETASSELAAARLVGLSHDEWLEAGRRSADKWRAATRVARAALADAPAPRMGVTETVPVHSLCTDAIEACARASEWRAGIDLLRELEASGRDAGPSAYVAALRGCGLAGESSAAIALVHRARSHDRAQCTVGVYSSAIEVCAEAERFDEAMELYALGVKDGTYHHWHDDEPFSLDLHGYTQAAAVCAVRHVLAHELGNYIPADLKIITGQGKHSPEGEGRYARARRCASLGAAPRRAVCAN